MNEPKGSLPHFKLAKYSVALNTDLLCIHQFIIWGEAFTAKQSLSGTVL